MAHLYILWSVATGRFYVGSTSDLTRRLSEHNREHSPFTRGRGPWKMVYQEEFENLREARRREHQIKSWKSRRAIEGLIQASPVG